MFSDPTRVAHFWSRVAIGAPEECWEWTAYRDRFGYGTLGWMKKMMLAHRVAMSLTDGEWNSRLLVLHRCDNPACCNPRHLWRGTQSQNMRDMLTKRRHTQVRGDTSGKSKLTTKAVLEIRASKLPNKILAAQLGVAITTVRSARSKISWRHLP